MAQISKKKKKKWQVLTFLTALYFHISIRIFCNLFICLVFDGLLQSICFRMYCSKHSITFDMYQLSCRFYCVVIFYINFRSCETFIITNSGAILFYWLKHSLSLELWKVDLSYTCKCMFHVNANSNVFCIPPGFPAFHIPLIFAR